MKKILLTLLALSKITSIYGMHQDMYAQLEAIHQTFKLDRKVVPFDRDSHGDKARSIFYRAFGFYPPYLKISDSMISPLTDPADRFADVLIADEKTIGVLAYHDKQENDGSITRSLDRFAIDEQYRGTEANHALFFIKEFEKKAVEDGISCIQLFSLAQALNFYKKAGYELFSGTREMKKILKKTEDTFS